MGNTLYPLLRDLLLAGGSFRVRQGKGSHEVWQSLAGKTFSVPVTLVNRHTANGILKQAGIAAKI